MKKFIKMCMFISLITVVIIAPVIIGVLLGKTIWFGASVSVILLSVFLVIYFIRIVWSRWREKKFIDGILEEEAADSAADALKSGEVASRWKEAMKALKRSHLKHRGNPLYVLPWYMVIGESGSGKTTALRNSGLTTGAETPSMAAGVAGTKQCDWWFFEQAIIIDTAGRYAIQPDDIQDRDEWRQFLHQLAKYRKKESLNGLVVTLPVDTILKSGEAATEDEGKKIRARVEELMRILGARFPVFILVTKCDLVNGMKEFCRFLPESVYNQAFGYMNREKTQDASQVVQAAFGFLSDSIRQYRLHITQSPEYNTNTPEVVLFPDEFQRLKGGIEAFVRGVFGEQVYQEAPLLRGIYFTSGRQKGQPLSHYLETLGIPERQNSDVVSDKGYFLHDFFSKILPFDRHLVTSTRKAVEWKRKIRLTGLSAWAATIGALCVFLSYSFAVNYSLLKEVRREFSRPPELKGEVIHDVNRLDYFKDTIKKLENRNNRQWMLSFGLNHCETLEKNLKTVFCNSFHDDFIQPMDKAMETSASGYSSKTPGEVLGTAMPFLIRRINLLSQRLAEDESGSLRSEPQPDFRILVEATGQKVLPEALGMIQNHYLQYLEWADVKTLIDERQKLRSRLEHLAARQGIPMDWLVSWCNSLDGLNSHTPGDYWSGSGKLNEIIRVEKAYTAKGYLMIHQMVDEFETALEDPLDIEKQKIDFYQSYRKNYLASWQTFARRFPEGTKLLTGKEEVLAVAKRMASGAGPYQALLKTLAKELAPMSQEGKELPGWVELVNEFNAVHEYASRRATVQNKGFIGKVAEKGMNLVDKVGSSNLESDGNASLMVPAEAYKQYMEGVSGIAGACMSKISSFNLATTVFTEDPAIGASPVFKAQRAVDEMKVSMKHFQSDQKLFGSLLKGPIDFLWGYVCDNAGCHLQGLWEETVLAEAEGIYDTQVLSTTLMGKGGYVKKYTGGPADPFISRSRKRGYYAKTVAGEKIPFSKKFFTYLIRGAYSAKSEENEYKVVFKGRPTDANPDAKLIPHHTKVELECAEGVQVLENYNYPVKKTFVWSPGECGNVTLKIYVGNLVLTKEYTGFRPFARFVKDFSNGQHTFYRSDFPEKNTELQRMGINYIKVKYSITGGAPVIKLLRMAAGKVPEVVVPCSD